MGSGFRCLQNRVPFCELCRAAAHQLCHRTGWVRVALLSGGKSRRLDTCFTLGYPRSRPGGKDAECLWFIWKVISGSTACAVGKWVRAGRKSTQGVLMRR